MSKFKTGAVYREQRPMPNGTTQNVTIVELERVNPGGHPISVGKMVLWLDTSIDVTDTQFKNIATSFANRLNEKMP